MSISPHRKESTDSQPISRRQAAKEKKYLQIEEAAARLLLKKSFEEITTKEVAAEAGIGEATFFRYIQNKQELLNLVYADRLDEVLSYSEEVDTQARLAQKNDAPGLAYVNRVLKVYEVRCNFYLENPSNAARYLREGFVPENPNSARHLAQGDRTIRLVSSILLEGQKENKLRNDVDVTIVAQNCHGSFMHEIDRTPARHFDPQTIWQRLEQRLLVQLQPLILKNSSNS